MRQQGQWLMSQRETQRLAVLNGLSEGRWRAALCRLREFDGANSMHLPGPGRLWTSTVACYGSSISDTDP